ncbi:MAG TPA: 50S ribosomal protein L10 [Nitrososphaerales archaeon]|nr:50S ribosomal protein L10 [Nitrososphaerales archaeon]
MSETVQVHKPNPKKAETIERVSELAQKYPVLAVTNLTKVRATQLMAVRKALRGHAEVFVVKNKLAIRGLQKAGIKNADALLSQLTGQNALIFSTYDPFKLFLTLDKNKVFLPARAGDKAPDDVMVPAGNTSLPAGPVLSEFREAGIATKIEGGSIWVNKDSVAIKKGDMVTPKLASLLSKLNIKPIRAGLTIALAYESGLIYAGDVVAIDLEKYRQSLLDAYSSSRGLAVFIGFVTKETAPDILAKAWREAMSLAVAAGFLSKETAPMVLGKAEAEAAALIAAAGEKGLQ